MLTTSGQVVESFATYLERGLKNVGFDELVRQIAGIHSTENALIRISRAKKLHWRGKIIPTNYKLQMHLTKGAYFTSEDAIRGLHTQMLNA